MSTTRTENPYPNVPLPAGAMFGDEWQPEGHRTVEGEERRLCQPALFERGDDIEIKVGARAIQHADGRVDDGEIETPAISVDGLYWEGGISADTARRLADLLVQAADQIDRWLMQ